MKVCGDTETWSCTRESFRVERDAFCEEKHTVSAPFLLVCFSGVTFPDFREVRRWYGTRRESVIVVYNIYFIYENKMSMTE